MTSTIKIESGGTLRVSTDSGVGGPNACVLRVASSAVVLQPRDVGRLIAALTRTKAARQDRNHG